MFNRKLKIGTISNKSTKSFSRRTNSSLEILIPDQKLHFYEAILILHNIFISIQTRWDDNWWMLVTKIFNRKLFYEYLLWKGLVSLCLEVSQWKFPNYSLTLLMWVFLITYLDQNSWIDSLHYNMKIEEPPLIKKKWAKQ